MKTIYILLIRSCTVLSKCIHLVTDDEYTHVSLAFDESLDPLYSSSRKNGVTILPSGPCYERLSRGILAQHPDIPCKLFALETDDESYERAKALAEQIVGAQDHFNVIGLAFCRMNIPLHRSRHYFCSQFVSEVLTESRALALPKDCTLMKPMDYSRLPELRPVYKGTLGELTRLSKRKAVAVNQ